MSRDALLFLLLSWGFVLGLAIWSFGRVLSRKPRE